MLALNIVMLVLAGCVTVDDALDRYCKREKAAQNAALKSTVGVGNRCKPAETAREVAGVDG